MNWQVLGQNTKLQDMYKRIGAIIDTEWLYMTLDQSTLNSRHLLRQSHNVEEVARTNNIHVDVHIE